MVFRALVVHFIVRTYTLKILGTVEMGTRLFANPASFRDGLMRFAAEHNSHRIPREVLRGGVFFFRRLQRMMRIV